MRVGILRQANAPRTGGSNCSQPIYIHVHSSHIHGEGDQKVWPALVPGGGRGKVGTVSFSQTGKRSGQSQNPPSAERDKNYIMLAKGVIIMHSLIPRPSIGGGGREKTLGPPPPYRRPGDEASNNYVKITIDKITIAIIIPIDKMTQLLRSVLQRSSVPLDVRNSLGGHWGTSTNYITIHTKFAHHFMQLAKS